MLWKWDMSGMLELSVLGDSRLAREGGKATALSIIFGATVVAQYGSDPVQRI